MASGTSIRRTLGSVRLAAQLGEALVTARGERTRRALATEAGVAPSTLADVERATANPTLAYVEQLADLYGVDIDLVVRPR